MRLSYVGSTNPLLSTNVIPDEINSFNYPIRFPIQNSRAKTLEERFLTEKPDMYNKCKQTIESFCLFEEDWDGYGALPIHPQTKKNALEFLNFYAINAIRVEGSLFFPELTPNTNGTINFEWEDLGKIANLDIGKTQLSFFITQPNHEPIIYDGNAADPLSYGKVFTLILDAFFPRANYSNAISNITYSDAFNPI